MSSMVNGVQDANKSRWMQALDHWFFARKVPYGLALMRILLPLALLVNASYRWPWARELFSTDGAAAPLADNFGYYNFLPVPSGGIAVAMYTALLLLLVCSSVGWCTRISLLAGAALYSYFGMLDCLSTMTKYTVIATHLLVLLGISNCGELWSVDAWFRGRKRRDPFYPDLDSIRYSVWPQRLMQLLLAAIYFGSGITKIHTPMFFSGDQLVYWMMTVTNNSHPLGQWMSQYPILLVVSAYITVTWEMSFVFCAWRPRLCLPMLAIGALFHVMTTLTLGLLVFPTIMILSYLCFMTEEDFQRLACWGRRLRRRWSSLAAFARLQTRVLDRLTMWVPPQPRLVVVGAFALVVSLVSLAGVEAEYWMDPYHLRNEGGPLALQPMDRAEARRLLQSDDPIRQVDKFMALDLGMRTAAGHLLDPRSTFTQGDGVIAQVSLTPPHEDMWVECNLVDGADRLICRMGHIVTRDMLRTHFSCMLDSGLEPGEYAFVVKSKGQEVMRRPFLLTPSASTAGQQASAAAN